ncbi:hypothetical protein GCM10025868_04160 [Angustibacter aerolatus]|uniref:NADP-dependent oxidoreductase domain-containing protein n=1 Tax=Angustibacter aerolatus TaxID=1162965 RepID=A0ABQ6JAF4_9ACTN|nr:hypothetical protein GCM10025868_04160 [Angustibacter aerolatus]
MGRFLRERGADRDALTVASRLGRRADPFEPASFTAEAMRGWVDRSLANLDVDALDLVRLHCPPTAVYDDDAVFDALDEQVAQGRLRAYGVSVETVAEAMTAIARPNVATVQIILNVFRRKPLEQVLPAAVAAGVGIIARVPLASGLLTGRYDESTTFAADDHRAYNRRGEAFDVGETFAGVPFEVGVEAAREVAALTPEGATTAQARPALGRRPAGCQHRHPGGPVTRAGPRQRGGRAARAARRVDAALAGGRLRQPGPRARARPLVR